MDSFTKWLNTGGGAILWQTHDRKHSHTHAFSGRASDRQTCTGCGFIWEATA